MAGCITLQKEKLFNVFGSRAKSATYKRLLATPDGDASDSNKALLTFKWPFFNKSSHVRKATTKELCICLVNDHAEDQ